MIKSRSNDPRGGFLSTWLPTILVTLGILVMLAVFLLLVQWAFLLLLRSAEEQTYASDALLADFDGDGDLDLFLAARTGELMASDSLWINQGGAQGVDGGAFRDSGQRLGDNHSTSVSAADLNGDGFPDVVVGGWGLHYYTNDGAGTLLGPRRFGRQLPDGASYAPRAALGDLDGDGFVDAFIGGCCGGATSPAGPSPTWTTLPPASATWLNDNKGIAGAVSGVSLQELPAPPVMAVALADLDGDGDLDAFAASGDSAYGPGEPRSEPNVVWLNDGDGVFHVQAELHDEGAAGALALGDVDGDGDLDAVIGNREFAAVWLNDGGANFRDGGQRLDGEAARWLFLADLDSDGDLDLLAGGARHARIWLNDGAARFTVTDQRIDYASREALALGDVTGDGIADILIASPDAYQLWQGQGDATFVAGSSTTIG